MKRGGEGEEKGASTREICFFSGPLPARSNYALAKRARAQKPTVPVMSLLELFFLLVVVWVRELLERNVLKIIHYGAVPSDLTESRDWL